MAIVNNIGQIHAALGRTAKAEQCYQQLLTAVMFLNNNGSTVDQMEGFVLSVMHLLLKQGSSPASAA